jgi:hypothetical protein
LSKLEKDKQTVAQAVIEGLRREIRMFPEFDYKAAVLSVAGSGDETVTSKGPSPLRNPIRDTVSKFLSAADDFDLQTTHIESYIRRQPSPATAQLPENTKPAVVNQLKRVQRAFRVTPKPEHITTLPIDGIDSAHAIASFPQSSFVKQFAGKLGGVAPAKAIHSQATVMNASALNVYRQVYAALSDITPRSLEPVASEVASALKALPSWETLFGSLSFCDCQKCQSVLGAVAYFVDLLQFLKKSTPNDKGQTPLDILLTRRPDLPFIKLNCEDTDALLPYTDLVNEILEAYVASVDPKITHSTGDATADELSLYPQFIIDPAYITLKPGGVSIRLAFRPAARSWFDPAEWKFGLARWNPKFHFPKGGEYDRHNIPGSSRCESRRLSALQSADRITHGQNESQQRPQFRSQKHSKH